jgi:hypothetical protein
MCLLTISFPFITDVWTQKGVSVILMFAKACAQLAKNFLIFIVYHCLQRVFSKGGMKPVTMCGGMS